MPESSPAREASMSWFAAHVVMVVRHKSGRQKRFPVWENIFLIQAASEEQAFAKAEARGRQDEGDDDGSFTWDGHPAAWVFAGVRKLTACEPADKRPGDLAEITYSEFELSSEYMLEAYVRGEHVDMRSTDLLPESAAPTAPAAANASRIKRA
jgi:hypothetical protein